MHKNVIVDLDGKRYLLIFVPLSTPIEELEISIRSANLLAEAGVTDVEEFLAISDDRFAKFPKVVQRELRGIQAMLLNCRPPLR